MIDKIQTVDLRDQTKLYPVGLSLTASTTRNVLSVDAVITEHQQMKVYEKVSNILL